MRQPVVDHVFCHRPRNGQMEGALVPETRSSDPSGCCRAVPLAKEYLVLGPRPSDLVLHPDANERHEKLEAVQGAAPNPVRRQQQSPGNPALKAVAPHLLGACVDTNDPSLPTEHKTVDRDPLGRSIREDLPQFQIVDRGIGELN